MRSEQNNAALAQLPFNGKQTVPAALRKDLWHPFALISFPPKSGPIGLSVFQKLREYRKRHELEWGDEIVSDSTGKPRTRIERGRLLCDQKANSVADMAAVLSRLSLKEEMETAGGKEGSIGLSGEGTGEKVEVRWSDLKDAEFAETWSENVEHGLMEMHTNNRAHDKLWGKFKWRLEKMAGKSTKKMAHEAEQDRRREAKRLKREQWETGATIEPAKPQKAVL